MAPNGRWRTALLALGIAVVIGGLFVGYLCPPRTPCYCNYLRVKPGMTLAEVERLIGPGTRISGPPMGSGKPFVRGDEFYSWRDGYDHVVAGFVGGVVFDKYYKNWNYM